MFVFYRECLLKVMSFIMGVYCRERQSSPYTWGVYKWGVYLSVFLYEHVSFKGVSILGGLYYIGSLLKVCQ